MRRHLHVSTHVFPFRSEESDGHLGGLCVCHCMIVCRGCVVSICDNFG